jgi:hypothetical protein
MTTPRCSHIATQTTRKHKSETRLRTNGPVIPGTKRNDTGPMLKDLEGVELARLPALKTCTYVNKRSYLKADLSLRTANVSRTHLTFQMAQTQAHYTALKRAQQKFQHPQAPPPTVLTGTQHTCLSACVAGFGAVFEHPGAIDVALTILCPQRAFRHLIRARPLVPSSPE